jgi:hypothetical protein
MTGVLRDPKPSWPFHRHTTSEVPSTPLTSLFRFPWRPRSILFRPSDTDAVSVSSRSLVPDYVVNYMMGETPETMARKREQRAWGARNVEITPRRDTFHSRLLDIEDPASSTTHLNPMHNAYANERQRHRGLQRYTSGWRGGVSWNILLVVVMALVSLISFIYIAVVGNSVVGETTLYSGPCSAAANVNIGLHVLAAIFGMAQLAGANYVVHVLSSPTRMELAHAHGRKRWLDIGITSLRNLRFVSMPRSLLAIAVLAIGLVTSVM